MVAVAHLHIQEEANVVLGRGLALSEWPFKKENYLFVLFLINSML